MIDGKLTPESNVRFDASLKSRDHSWGIRELNAGGILDIANKNGLSRVKVIPMPVNNHCVIYRKS